MCVYFMVHIILCILLSFQEEYSFLERLYRFKEPLNESQEVRHSLTSNVA